MEQTERVYRVVRYFTDFSGGDMQEVIASGLSLTDAERLVNQNRDVPGEETVIENQAGGDISESLDSSVGTGIDIGPEDTRH